MTVVVTLDTKKLDGLIAVNDPRAEKIVKSFALQVEAGAKTRAPVDTGALKNSLQAEPESRLTWQVHDGVEYGIYQELGTHKMRAQPFMIPAVEALRQRWNDAWKELLK